MEKVADNVMEKVLDLPADARIGLVNRILTSLNLPIQQDIERLWSEEAERRVEEIERGEVLMIPGEEVFSRIRQKYAT